MKQGRERIYIFLFSCLILFFFYLRFEVFFPNIYGHLGHDYSLTLSHLLDGDYWFRVNGLFAVPWFTPSFGGGLPKFPNPQSLYYSFPQFLSFLVNPLLSVRITILVFGILGFTGFYLFLRRIFLLDKFLALLGSTLFLFNSFYLARMIVGAINFHSYMLFPFLALLIFRNLKNNKKLKIINDILLGSLIIAYMVYSGAFHLIPILLLCLIIFFVIFNLTIDSSCNYMFLTKLLLVFIVGILLSAAQLNASMSYIGLFPRDHYDLPGFENMINLFLVCMKSLFYKAFPLNYYNEAFRSGDLDLHECEYGLTFIPLIFLFLAFISLISKPNYKIYFSNKNIVIIVILVLLLCIALSLNYYTPTWKPFQASSLFIKTVVLLFNCILFTILIILNFAIIYVIRRSNFINYFSNKNIVKIVILLVLLSIPLCLNYYTPFWNAFLKSIPFIKNSSTLIRWFSAYIPVVILLTCMSYKHIRWIQNYKKTVVSISIILIIFVGNFMLNKGYYHHQPFNPEIILENYKMIKSKDFSPEITTIANEVEINGQTISTNDIFTAGFSQIQPYEPIFGYWLEKFPKKTLTAGSVMLTNSEGYLNIKNPASYVFPEENNLTPGEHFKINQKEYAQRFVKYQSFPFNISTRQKYANYITIISFCLLIVYSVFYCLLTVRKKIYYYKNR